MDEEKGRMAVGEQKSRQKEEVGRGGGQTGSGQGRKGQEWTAVEWEGQDGGRRRQGNQCH